MESMVSYLFRRLLWVPPVLFVVSFFTFALVRLGPGDPIRIAAGQFRDPDAFARIRHARGLDKPLYVQYGIYIQDVLTKGELGESFRYKGRDVGELRLMQMTMPDAAAAVGPRLPQCFTQYSPDLAHRRRPAHRWRTCAHAGRKWRHARRSTQRGLQQRGARAVRGDAVSP